MTVLSCGGAGAPTARASALRQGEAFIDIDRIQRVVRPEGAGFATRPRSCVAAGGAPSLQGCWGGPRPLPGVRRR